MGGSQAWLGGPQAWLGGPQAWLGGPTARLGGPQAWLGSPQVWLGGPQAWLEGPQVWLEVPQALNASLAPNSTEWTLNPTNLKPLIKQGILYFWAFCFLAKKAGVVFSCLCFSIF